MIRSVIYRDATENDIPFMKEMLVESCIASGVTSIMLYLKNWTDI